MPSIADIRRQYPDYADLSDTDLADRLHARFYSDMPRDEFDMKVGLVKMEEPSVADTVGRVAGRAAGMVAKGVGSFGDIANTITNLGIAGVNKVAGTEIAPLPMLTEEIDRSGVFPAPRNTTERVVDRIGQEVVANAVPLAPARILARGLPSATPTVTQNVARMVADSPATDLAVGVGAGVAGSAADELAPDSPVARMLAPIFGGVVGGVGFAGAARAIREAAARRRGIPVEEMADVTPADIATVLADEPDLLAVAKAAGIEGADDPRLAMLRERLAARRDAEAARPAEMPGNEADLNRMRAEAEAVAAGDMDPAARSFDTAPRKAPPEVIRQGEQVAPVEAAPEQAPPYRVPGEAIDPGTQAGFEANGGRAAVTQKALPAPGAESRPTSMSDTEVAQARARAEAEAAPPRTTEPSQPPERMVAPEGRAPQTPEQVQGQREAGEAFRQAETQRGRAGAEIRDTQPAGMPKGPQPQRVLMDDGFPVQESGPRSVETVNGRDVEMATVRRYDPRTGQPDPDAVDYKVPVRQLRQSSYTPEPRAAQDFAERAKAPPAPEQPRMASEPVRREPDQTYRTTQPDPNEQFPGAGSKPAGDGGARPPGPDTPPAGGGEAVGRSPIPEQAEAPSRFRDYSEAEAHFRAREQARAEAGSKGRAEQDAGQQARAKAEAKYGKSKASNTAAAQDADGRYPIDEFGFVRSDKSGPIKFADQKQAARWIVGEGQKKSPDQHFEIENHPSGSGFTVRERGRNPGPQEPPPSGGGPKPTDGPKSEAGSSAPPPARQESGQAGRGAGAEQARTSAGHDGGAERAAAAENGTRAPSEAPPKGDAEPTLKDAVDTASRLSNRSATFYSNPFGDPEIWKAVGRTIGRSSEWLTANARESLEQIAGIRASSEGSPRGGIRNVIETPRYVARALLMSNDGRLRSLARRTGIKEFEEIADLVQPTGTAGRDAVGRGYQEAFHARLRERQSDIAKVLEPLNGDRNLAQQVKAAVIAGKTSGDTPVAKAAAEVARILKEELEYRRAAGVETGQVKNYFPRMLDTLEVVKSSVAFEKAVATEYRKTGLSGEEATRAAKEMTERILSGEAGADGLDFRRHSTATKSEKARSFGPSADTTLKRWLVNDPVDALMRYSASTAKRVELAKRFGVDGEKMDAMVKSIIEKGGRDFAGEAISAWQAATGQLRADRMNGRVQNALSWLRTFQTLSLLEKATISSMNDLVGPMMRTGKVTDLPKVVGRYIQQMSGHGIEAKERAEILGVIGRGYEGAMMARAGVDPSTRAQELVLRKFFMGNLLEQHTHAARVANMSLLEAEMRTYARDIAEGRRGKGVAARRLEEFGIARNDQRAFSQWLLSNEGLPDAKVLKGDKGFAEQYRTAVIRGSSFIADPNAALKPWLASHPVGALVFHLQSFNYAFTKMLYRVGGEAYTAVTNKNWRTGESAGLDPLERLAVAKVALALPVLYAVGYGMSAARDNVLDQIGEAITGHKAQTRREKTTGEKAIEAGSRAGLFGALDPLINAATGVRYGKEPLVALLGPLAGQFSTNVKNILAPNSDRTNTKERNIAGAAYSLFIEPAMNAGISLTSPSPWLSFALMAGGTGNPAIKNAWQTWFGGKETPRPQRGEVAQGGRGASR